MAELDLDHEELMPENCETAAAPEDGTAAPSAGGEARCTASHQEMMDEKMQPIKEQLQYFLSKADEFQTHVVYSSDRQQRDAFARVVPTFLQTCQPYFTYLESTAHNSSPGRIPLPLYIRTRLLQFSEQLCSRLEQLLLMYASFGYLSLEEADPLGISHFYIGQCQVDNIKLSIFRYCLPSPFLTSTDSGLYKRMRWNVERESGTEKAAGVMRAEDRVVVRMWSIGQWVQTDPDPYTEDIYEILCTVPQGQYREIVRLGGEEPSSCFATECLLGVLLSQIKGSFTSFAFSVIF
uniref:Si:ch211-214c7.5 n=1 Tax=Astyanax mexicanus TaxID=7994 RepID=A0A8B9M2I5_ASTMX